MYLVLAIGFMITHLFFYLAHMLYIFIVGSPNYPHKTPARQEGLTLTPSSSAPTLQRFWHFNHFT
ncbi:hypothetical protein Rhal01_01752 [Rubritalea halochordaticola]|uniref:Uncharacterized protein n=1 Tax=Rubritalea halochordaticola TaxID=714537 RepID=A0ABP9UYQ5_9BACT